MGPGTAFTKVYTAARAGTKDVKLITLPWWEHPDKGRHRRLVVQEDGSKKYTVTCKPNYDVLASTTMLLDPTEEPDLGKMIAKHQQRRAELAAKKA